MLRVVTCQIRRSGDVPSVQACAPRRWASPTGPLDESPALTASESTLRARQEGSRVESAWRARVGEVAPQHVTPPPPPPLTSRLRSTDTTMQPLAPLLGQSSPRSRRTVSFWCRHAPICSPPRRCQRRPHLSLWPCCRLLVWPHNLSRLSRLVTPPPDGTGCRTDERSGVPSPTRERTAGLFLPARGLHTITRQTTSSNSSQDPKPLKFRLPLAHWSIWSLDLEVDPWTDWWC